MATKEYDFKYLPLEGKLTGKSFEAQTEKAINELGQTVVNVEVQFDGINETAQEAYNVAKDALDTADSAKTTAGNALEAAQTAQSTANSAQTAANAAQQSADDAQNAADKAQERADEAKSAADAAQTDATEALEKMQELDDVKLTADTALENTNYNSNNIAILNDEVEKIKNYEVVGEVDLNEYYLEFARIYVETGSENAPTSREQFFVDVDIDMDITSVRQIATGVSTGTIYIRNGVLTKEEPDDGEPDDGEQENDNPNTDQPDKDEPDDGDDEPDDGDDDSDYTVEWGEWKEIRTNSSGGGGSGIDAETGTIAMFAGENIPSGWLLCNGAEVKKYDYPDLYDVIGDIYSPTLPITYGTVSITGDLSVDLTVNGNVEVSGEISSNVVATGYIRYGSLTGTAVMGIGVKARDIEVDGGTLTFAAGVSEGENGEMNTTGQITNDSDAQVTFYKSLTVNGTLNNQFYNDGGTVIIEDGACVDVTSSISSTSSNYETIYNTGEIIVREGGKIIGNCSAAAYGMWLTSAGVFTCYGEAEFYTENSSRDGIVNNGGEIIVKDGGKITATGGRYGLYNYSTSSSDLTVESGGTFIAEGATYGIYVAVGTVNISGDVTANATASGGYGIYNTATLTTVSGSDVTATGGTYGLRSTVTTNLGGKFTAEGTGTSGVGIYNSAGTLTINEDGDVKAIGYLYGIQSTTTFNGYGKLTATISSEGVSSTYAVYQNSTFNLYEGGLINATNGERAWNNSGGTLTAQNGSTIIATGDTYGLYGTGTLNLNGQMAMSGSTSGLYCTGTLNMNASPTAISPMED